MEATVRVKHDRHRSTTVVSRFGSHVFDARGFADVSSEMADMVASGQFGESWHLAEPAKEIAVPSAEQPTEPQPAKTELPPLTQHLINAVELEETTPIEKPKAKARTKQATARTQRKSSR